MAMLCTGLCASAQSQAMAPKAATASPVRQLTENLRKSGFKGLGQLSAPQASIPRRTSFYERVLVLVGDGGVHAVVPQGSILHLPDAHRQRVGTKPEGKLISWEALLSQSRSWLGTQEISLAAARGNSREVDAVASQLALDRRIIVAINKGRPIAILQSAEPATPPAKGSQGRRPPSSP
jgi:hypothetical protein